MGTGGGGGVRVSCLCKCVLLSLMKDINACLLFDVSVVSVAIHIFDNLTMSEVTTAPAFERHASKRGRRSLGVHVILRPLLAVRETEM